MSWTASALTDPNAALWASIRPPKPPTWLALLRERATLSLRSLADPLSLPEWTVSGRTAWAWLLASSLGLAIGLGVGLSARSSDKRKPNGMQVVRTLEPSAPGAVPRAASLAATPARTPVAPMNAGVSSPAASAAAAEGRLSGAARDDVSERPAASEREADEPSHAMASAPRVSNGEALDARALARSGATCPRCSPKSKASSRKRAAAATRRRAKHGSARLALARAINKARRPSPGQR